MLAENKCTYAGVSLYDTYGLVLLNMDTTDNKSVGGNLEYITFKNKQTPKTSVIDSFYTEPLVIDVEFISVNNIITSSDYLNLINLLYQNTYKQLIINEDLYDGYHINCYFTNIERIEFGKEHRYGIKATMNCDSSFMWSDDKFSQTYTTFPFSLNNNSCEKGYIYPKVVITAGTTGGQIKLQNVTDNNRLSIINNVLPNEVITMTSNPKIITGSSHESIYENFNKKWLRLLYGINNIGIVGDIVSVKIEYEKARVII